MFKVYGKSVAVSRVISIGVNGLRRRFHVIRIAVFFSLQYRDFLSRRRALAGNSIAPIRASQSFNRARRFRVPNQLCERVRRVGDGAALRVARQGRVACKGDDCRCPLRVIDFFHAPSIDETRDESKGYLILVEDLFCMFGPCWHGGCYDSKMRASVTLAWFMLYSKAYAMRVSR